jgi:predicted DNA-binding mobile mystery protein A
MSQRQLAERANVSSTSVRSAEVNEARGTIQLDSLTTLAKAMDCDVVYAIVPRASLREILEHQAEQIARDLVDQVSDSMDLESQGVDPAERAQQLEDLKAEVLRDRGRDFWDV